MSSRKKSSVSWTSFCATARGGGTSIASFVGAVNSRIDEVAKEYADLGMWNIGGGENAVRLFWGL